MMADIRNSKTIKAYNFLLNRECKKTSFSLLELTKATGWKISTVKTYVNKQWKNFIHKSKGKYFSQGLTTVSQDDFVKAHSQTLKYSLETINERNRLVLKAHQFALLSIYNYNNPYSEFRTYGFIVNIVIAWTALFHAIFQKEGIDYFCKSKSGELIHIAGQPKVWELKSCIQYYWGKDTPCKSNLSFLIELRNEIEHRHIPLIDIIISAHCQACINNFEDLLTKKFGEEYALTKNISLALQLSRTTEQMQAIKKLYSNSCQQVRCFMDNFEDNLPDDVLKSPQYRMGYHFTRKISNHKTSADIAVEFVENDSDQQSETKKIHFREKEKIKYKPKQVVQFMHDEGYAKFNMHHHTQLWKKKNARKNKKYAVQLSDGAWYWYADWLDVVREYCKTSKLA